MDKDELIDFLNEIKGHKYEPILFTTVFTGLRLGEVLGLTWDCIDFDNCTITVEKQHGRDRATGEYIFTSIKNDQTRVLTAAEEVMNVLRAHKRQQRQTAKEAGKAWSNPKNLVFTTETGRYIENKMLYMYFKRVMKKIGMSDMRFHDLRHTYAVNTAGEPGSCNRRIYAQHICSCNTEYENRRRTKNEQLHSYGDVRGVTNRASRSILTSRSFPSLFPFCPLCTAFIFKTKKISVFKGFRPQRKH